MGLSILLILHLLQGFLVDFCSRKDHPQRFDALRSDAFIPNELSAYGEVEMHNGREFCCGKGHFVDVEGLKHFGGIGIEGQKDVFVDADD